MYKGIFLILAVSMLTLTSNAQNCNNNDLEYGNLTGWTTTGIANVVSGGVDFYGGFPLNAPGGSFSLQLGDNSTYPQPVSDVSTAQKSFVVTAAQPFLKYQYAFVLLDYPHTAAEAARGSIQILDQNGNTIPCTFFQVFAAAGGPAGFQTSTRPQEGNFSSQCCYNISYLPWQTAYIDLRPYIGQVVTISLLNSWCIYHVDWGYSYFDAECINLEISKTDNCTTSTLSVPNVFSNYNWVGPGVTNGQGTNQITVNQSGQYTVTLTDNTGCTFNLSTTITIPNGLPTPNFSMPKDTICINENITLTNLSTDVNGNNLSSVNWDFGDGITSTVENPTHSYTVAGVYPIKIYASDGSCIDSLTKNIVVPQLPQANFSTNQVCADSSATPTIFTDLSTADPGETITHWEWDIFDDNSIDYTSQSPQHVFPVGGSHNVSLIVETEKGCRSNEYIGQVTVNYIPTSNFTSTTACLGQLTTLTDVSTVTNANINSTQWALGDATTANTSTVNHIYPDSGYYDVQLTVMSNFGCKKDTTISIYVRELPKVDFTVSDKCVYETVTTSNSSTINVGSLSTFQWNFNDNTPLDNAPLPTHNFSTPDIYDVVLTVTSNFGCVDSLHKSVAIYDKPTADFTTQTVCLHQTTNLLDASTINNVINNDIVSQWQWDVENNNSIDYSTQNAQHIYPTEGGFNGTLFITTQFGCKDTVTKPIDVWPLPEVNFNFSHLCHGEITEFNELSTISNIYTNNSLTNFAWDFGDGNISSGQSTTNQYLNYGDYNVTLTATSNHGCIDSLTQLVPIHPLPQPYFKSNSICINTPPTTLVDSSTIPTGTITQLDWSFSDGGNAMGTLVTHSYMNATSPTYVNEATLIATSNFNCIDSITLPVTVYEKPTADFTSNETRVCNPGNIEYTDMSYSNNTTINEWQWNFYNNHTSEEHNPTINYTNDTETPVFYDVELISTNSYGCKDTIKKDNYIVVIPQPIANFYASPSLMNVQDTETEFINQSQLSDEYLWNFGDGSENSIEFEPNHEYPAVQQDYVVELIAYNYNQFCSDTAYTTIIIKDIIIFYVPNIFTPDNDEFNQTWKPVFTAGVDPYDFHLMVYNRWGEIVWESYNYNAEWNGFYNGKLVEDGVYVWTIEFKETMSDKRHNYTGHVTILK